MAYQKVFKRYEIKYMITTEQMQRIMAAMAPYMMQDQFGHATIRNIYFDTDDYILARHSIVKPDFKEKLRMRSYSKAGEDSEVFVELKRKFDKVVYKRRVGLSEKQAMDWTCRRINANAANLYSDQDTVRNTNTGRSMRSLSGGLKPNDVVRQRPDKDAGVTGNNISSNIGEGIGSNPVNEQLGSEIDYFLDYYGNLKPAVFLSYDREAFKMKDGSDFRVTFDRNILARDSDLSLESDVYGTPVLEEGKALMELKCSGGIPLWMTKVLSQEHIYKTSFSKYGKAYTQMILPALQQEHLTAASMEEAAEMDPHAVPKAIADSGAISAWTPGSAKRKVEKHAEKHANKHKAFRHLPIPFHHRPFESGSLHIN